MTLRPSIVPNMYIYEYFLKNELINSSPIIIKHVNKLMCNQIKISDYLFAAKVFKF